MANHRQPTRGRVSRSSIGQTDSNRKYSRTRRSRVSLQSSASDVNVSVIDSEDGQGHATGPKNDAMTPQQVWAAFENCVKRIDNTSPECFAKKPKPTFVSSGTFQQVMLDMYGNTEYANTKGYTILKQKLSNMAKATGLAARMMNRIAYKGQDEDEEDDSFEYMGNDESDAGDEYFEPEGIIQATAKRGWTVLKRQVNENVMEQKTQTQKLNWLMLQHTLKQMSNMERARQDLYERYGIVPTTLSDGRVVCENQMLSDRARAQIYGQTEADKPGAGIGRLHLQSMNVRSKSYIGQSSSRMIDVKSPMNAKARTFRPFTAK
ncbi:hypothetical protein DPMN_192720 [Dreissena polymorpha]|uniref:Uncharacterized protein n=1 Tax=Dreissena polymorpha TaxID=45954 RepID=A0A9D4B8M6_DREPO|nr:hypothetical protein DPMN_192720 [Dreissena polymorpha]